MNQYPIWIGLTWALVMVSVTSNPLWWMVAVLGMGANGVVVAANGWKMPVRGLLEESIRHCPMIASTRRKWLGDVIPTGLGTASIGDFLIAAGLLGVFANRESFTYTTVTLLLAILWWASGWARGFLLLEKWTSEARRDARKNLPIIVVLMLIGNFLHVRGCSVGELHAAAKEAKSAIVPEQIIPKKAKPESKWRDLGEIVAPPPVFLRRLREATAKQELESNKEAATKAVIAFAGSQSWSFTNALSPKGARKGPFCRITCAAHHGGQYDVETVPEFCRSNWIPPNALKVPGWYSISEKEEMTAPWPGPAEQGFENYKLYWSELQSAAKMVHASQK